MPTYGYRCPHCGKEFDVWQRMSDEPGAACPACGATARRVFYPAGIVFKGTGFYATDSRRSAGDGSGSKASADGGGSKASGTAPSTSSSDGTKSNNPSAGKPAPASENS